MISRGHHVQTITRVIGMNIKKDVVIKLPAIKVGATKKKIKKIRGK